MTNSQKKVLREIIKQSRGSGFTLKTNQFLADEIDVSAKTISRMVKLLKEGGQITCRRVDNRRQISIVRVDSGEDQNTKVKYRDIDEKDYEVENQSTRLTDAEIQQDMDDLLDVPEWKIATLMEFLKSECKSKCVISNINAVLMVRFVRVFKFKSVLESLEEYMEFSTGDILEKDFKRHLDEKYIKVVDVEKIRESVRDY